MNWFKFVIKGRYLKSRNQSPRLFLNSKFHSGQTLIEIIITTAIIVMAITAILGLVTHSLVAASSSKLKTQATFLAQETVEIANTIKDTNWLKKNTPWDTNLYTSDGWYKIENYNSTTGYKLTFLNSSETPDPTIVTLDKVDFTRYINITKENNNTRKIVVKVTWEERGNIQGIEISSSLTYYLISGGSINGIDCVGACGVDNDGDGYSEEDGDCADNDPDIYPGSGCPLIPVFAVFSGQNSGDSFAIKNDYVLWGWGVNFFGQLGDGSTTNRFSPVQTQFTNVESVSGGEIHTIVLKRDGTVWASGHNGNGQLGIGNFDEGPYSSPVQTSSLSNVKSIAVGNGHSMAIKEDGTLWAWGLNDYGQLGIGNTDNQNAPFQVGSDTDWKTVTGGGWHSLAIKEDGTLWAWGQNEFCQIGDGAPGGVGFDRLGPVQISLDQVSAVSGGYFTSYALRSGIDWSWGYNWNGVLGRSDGTCLIGGNCSTPGQVNIITEVARISGGREHAMALKSDGTVWAWGANVQGQLGDGTYNSNPNSDPRQSLVGGTVINISAGGYHSLALRDDGTVWTWGLDSEGALGDGDGDSTTSTPIQVPGLD